MGEDSEIIFIARFFQQILGMRVKGHNQTMHRAKRTRAEARATLRAPLTPKRVALLEAEFEPPVDPEEPAEAAAAVAAGGAVATAFTPPVTGPLSVSVCSLLPIA